MSGRTHELTVCGGPGCSGKTVSRWGHTHCRHCRVVLSQPRRGCWGELQLAVKLAVAFLLDKVQTACSGQTELQSMQQPAHKKQSTRGTSLHCTVTLSCGVSGGLPGVVWSGLDGLKQTKLQKPKPSRLGTSAVHRLDHPDSRKSSKFVLHPDYLASMLVP